MDLSQDGHYMITVFDARNYRVFVVLDIMHSLI